MSREVQDPNEYKYERVVEKARAYGVRSIRVGSSESVAQCTHVYGEVVPKSMRRDCDEPREAEAS